MYNTVSVCCFIILHIKLALADSKKQNNSDIYLKSLSLALFVCGSHCR